jgi:hypothetical protein
MSGHGDTPTGNSGEGGFRPFAMTERSRTASGGNNNSLDGGDGGPTVLRVDDVSPRGRTAEKRGADGSSSDILTTSSAGAAGPVFPARCINPASDVNSRLDTQVEVRVYPCNNSQGNGKKKFTTFNIKPEVRFVWFVLSV